MHATPGCIFDDPVSPRVHVVLLVHTVGVSYSLPASPLLPPLLDEVDEPDEPDEPDEVEEPDEPEELDALGPTTSLLEVELPPHAAAKAKTRIEAP
jgi:hypothetical protein